MTAKRRATELMGVARSTLALYDEKCLDLARWFYPNMSEERRAELAALIQVTVEDFPGDDCRHCGGERFRMTHPAGVREPCFACNHDAWPV